jgi:hypothetical protein
MDADWDKNLIIAYCHMIGVKLSKNDENTANIYMEEVIRLANNMSNIDNDIINCLYDVSPHFVICKEFIQHKMME